MLLIIQIIVVLIVVGIILAVVRSMPATFDPMVKWGIYALIAVLLCAWLLGLVGFYPAPWGYSGHPLR